MNLLDRLRLLRLFIAFVRNPLDTDQIFKAAKILRKVKDSPVFKMLNDHVMAKPDFRERYEEKYLPAWPVVADLARMPAGSFGLALYNHMTRNNLNFDLFPQIAVDTPVAYLNARIYLDHDLWHALLGYDTDIEGELGVQAFNIAQYRSPLGTMIIAGGLLHLLINDPLRCQGAVAKVAEGYGRGLKARFLPGLKLIDMLPLPLTEVHALTGIANQGAIGPSFVASV